MSDKYLPLGTICKIKNSDYLVMICGYYSIKFDNEIIMHDYRGCIYPEGLLKNNIISFNHNDIIEIIFKGYINDDYSKLNQVLLNQQKIIPKDKKVDLFKNFQYDDNGVVLYEPDESNQDNNLETQSFKSEVSNPFYSSYSDKQEVENTTSNSPIFKSIVFDENGIVISAEEN